MKCSYCCIAIGKKRKSVLNCEHVFCFRCIESRYACPLCKSVIETIDNQNKMVVRSPNVVNYDFGKNWESKIVPFLDHPDVQLAIRECVRRYDLNCDIFRKFDPCKPLASYADDKHYMWRVEVQEDMILEKHVFPDNPDLFLEEQELLLAHLYEWENIKHDLNSYYMSGACHWIAPTLMLTLARMVEPDEKWVVRESDDHTTVVNHDHTRVFDLLYWGLDGRLENYLFGNPVLVIDKSLGGRLALINSE